ncbi:DUF6686 family protein [Spirosoma sp. KNUC1025]|uniref:DUF6686 family protein n=1 Tax=Spirosoma sp. KNUC1025 TaxID=2894082 RepID=UPI00386BA5FF|nr:hypothetical protein LN737_27770 [Spirosoma sp. KNUC1025]
MIPCKPTLLFDQERFCIAHCQHCQRLGLTFQNLLMGFTRDEFIALCRTLHDADFEQRSTPMPNGESYLVINTGHPDIQFSLSRTEFGLLRNGLLHALRRLNLYQQLKNQAN